MTTTSSFVSTIPALGIWVACSVLICVLLIVTSGFACEWHQDRAAPLQRGLPASILSIPREMRHPAGERHPTFGIGLEPWCCSAPLSQLTWGSAHTRPPEQCQTVPACRMSEPIARPIADVGATCAQSPQTPSSGRPRMPRMGGRKPAWLSPRPDSAWKRLLIRQHSSSESRSSNRSPGRRGPTLSGTPAGRR